MYITGLATMTIASAKPYLIRAIYEWCLDQGFTPYLSVFVDDGTRVPREFVKDAQIVLNVGTEATQHLLMGNDHITFSARFNGVAQALSVPVENVLAIYARENGQGMAFGVETGNQDEASSDAGVSSISARGPLTTVEIQEPALPPSPSGKPHLRRIK